MARGLGKPDAKRAQAAVHSLFSTASMGEPCETKSTGYFMIHSF